MGSCPPGHSPEGVPGIQHRRGALAATSLPFPRSTRALPAPEPASRASRGTRAGPRARLSRPGRPEPARGKFLQLRRGLAAGAPGLGLVRLLASAATAAPLSDDRVPAPSRDTKRMDARGRRAGSRGPTEGTPGRRAAATSAPRVAPPPPAGLGPAPAAGKAGRGRRWAAGLGEPAAGLGGTPRERVAPGLPGRRAAEPPAPDYVNTVRTALP